MNSNQSGSVGLGGDGSAKDALDVSFPKVKDHDGKEIEQYFYIYPATDEGWGIYGWSVLHWDISAAATEYSTPGQNGQRLLQFNGEVSHSLGGCYGILANLKPYSPEGTIVVPSWMPNQGKMWAYKYVLYPGNLTEFYRKSTSSAQFELGARIPIPMLWNEGNRTFTLGSPKTEPSSFDSAFDSALERFGLPKPSFSGTLNQDKVWGDGSVYYTLKMTSGPTVKTDGSYSLSISASVVYAPSFTKCIDSGNQAAQFAALQHAPGEVEMCLDMGTEWGNLVRIHVGRGGNDQNQQAWLGVHRDGFGSVELHGSPDEFQPKYGYNSSTHPDIPVGGATFDHADYSSEILGSTGWSSRNAYITRWLVPRLTSIQGGDVYAKIEYSGSDSLSKTIKLYWAKEAQSPGTALKTIQINNQGGKASGIPVVKSRSFNVVEDGGRYYDASLVAGVNGSKDAFSFKVGASQGDSLWSKSTTVESTGNTVKLKTVEKQGVHVLSTIEEEYDSWASPFTSDRPQVKSQTRYVGQSSGTQTRTIDFTWTDVGADTDPYLFALPTKMKFTGADWDMDGREINYRTDATLLSDTRKVAGKTLKTTRNWTGTAMTETENLGGTGSQAPFRTRVENYSNRFQTVEVWLDRRQIATLNYNDSSGASGPPWALAEVAHAGGFRERWSFLQCLSASNDFNKVKIEDGWGSGLSSGQTTEITTDRLGGPVSRKTSTSDGVAIAEERGSTFTSWGAPKTVRHYRGSLPTFASSTSTYNETGLAWGTWKTEYDPFAVKRSVPGYDTLARPTGYFTGFDIFTFDYSDPLSLSATSALTGKKLQTDFSDFGEVTRRTSTFGAGYSLSRSAGGSGSITVEGRTANFGGDASGWLSTIDNGLGSRGAAFDLSVEEGMLVVTTTGSQKQNSRTYSSNLTKTFFDGKGRIVKVSRPDANGTSVSDHWDYTETSSENSVKFTPGSGPVIQSMKTTVSPDGSTVIFSKGNTDLVRQTRAKVGGTIELKVELNDDSTGAARTWKEMSRQKIDPTNGAVTMTPWGIAANAMTMMDSMPGSTATRTISGGFSNDSVMIQTQGGALKKLTSTVNGISGVLDITTAAGFVTAVSGQIGGITTGMKIGDDRRVSELWGAGTHQYLSYGHVDGGFQFGVADVTQGTTATLQADSVGDWTSISVPSALPLTMQTTDSATKSETTVNGQLKVTTNLQQATKSKSYSAGAITEDFTLNSDGSLAGFSVSSVAGGTVTQLPGSETMRFNDGTTVVQNFYDVGVRSSVSGPQDARSFTYQNLALKTETHTGGCLGGGAGHFPARQPGTPGSDSDPEERCVQQRVLLWLRRLFPIEPGSWGAIHPQCPRPVAKNDARQSLDDLDLCEYFRLAHRRGDDQREFRGGQFQLSIYPVRRAPAAH